MALLDNLLSDLIRSSTGINARPFVRMVGGKNILLLGGAAIAGALAAEKMGKQAAPAAPPPPPLPTGEEAPPPVPPLPPLPPLPKAVDDSAAAAAPPAIPQALLYGIVRTMVSAALADGEMHAEEKALIERRLEAGELSSDETKQVHRDLVIPPTPEELGRMVASVEDRELLYRFASLVVLAEGAVSPPERAWLDRLGAALSLDGARRAVLETELFEPT
jgi:uncharacterized membrane protein YebE (DUF533 family)